MCKNATQTAYDVARVIEPTLKAFLSYEGVLATPEGQAAIAAFDSMLITLQNWKSGTPAELALQALQAFQNAFAAVVAPLSIPSQVGILVNVILAGVETIIGILIGNSPAPAAIEDTPEAYQAHVIAATTKKVQQLVPTFHRSFFHSAASQYKTAWNHAVESGGLPNSMQV